jgi:uncharacterized membrane protein (UPF0182 family)
VLHVLLLIVAPVEITPVILLPAATHCFKWLLSPLVDFKSVFTNVVVLAVVLFVIKIAWIWAPVTTPALTVVTVKVSVPAVFAANKLKEHNNNPLCD